MIWFFAGGETRDDRFNVFTGSFIRLMKEIMGNRFDYIKGIYHPMPMMNVLWALLNAQKPGDMIRETSKQAAALKHILTDRYNPETKLIMVSSSSGSIIAAQTACLIAERNRDRLLFRKPVDLALGSSMISGDSDLYRKLKEHQNSGAIGRIILDELHDEGDNSTGIGGRKRSEALMNAFFLMLPWLSGKFTGPSFLNTHPVKGHPHRRRSQTIKKALDYIDVILVKHKLAGDYYKETAAELIRNTAEKITV